MNLLKHTFELTILGSTDVYLMVRAGFVNQGTTLNRWCIAKGINRQTAEKALKGLSTSRAALALVQQALADATQKTPNND